MIFNVTSGQSVALPVLDAAYPADVTTTYRYGKSTSATFKAVIAEHGRPADYTYQWYVDGSPVSGATGATFTKSGLNADKTYKVYCEVTNKAGTVTTREATLKVSLYKLYLYNKGNQCSSITGGWTSRSEGNKKITLNSDSIAVNAASSNAGMAVTSNKIDLTDISVLEVNIVKHVNTTIFGVTTATGYTHKYTAQVQISGAGKATIDVSGLSGNYYVGVSLYCGYTASMEFDMICGY